MKLIIAEKPKLASNIVAAIGSNKFRRKDGFFEGDEYFVTCTFGHLFGLLDIEEYLPKDIREENPKWTLRGLPFRPEKFKYGLRKDPKTHKVDPGVRKQFGVIKALCGLKDVDSIIHAGDADREGEIIIRTILSQANNKKPVFRLWLPDQTPETIRAGLCDLVSDSDYDTLANEGYARSYIDWLYGINLTRLASIKSGSLLRTGRVIVPIVKAIYDRDLEIRNFVPEKYIGLVSKEKTKGETIELTSKRTFAPEERDAAQEHSDRLNAAGAVVTSAETNETHLKPGKLYSLSKLQGVMGKKFKMSPSETLALVQQLYDAGYLTYPRTNTEYLATAEREKTNRVLQLLQEKGYKVCPKDKSKSIYDDSKIESHSALTPTSKLAEEKDLSEDEWKVYSTILNRFLAVFCSEKCTVNRTVIKIQVGDIETFKISGDVLVSEGWLQYDNSGRSDKVLPALAVGDVVNIGFKPVDKETKPPKHYTVDTLLNYLKNPFREEKRGSSGIPNGEDEAETSEADAAAADDQEYKAMFEGVELGTEATRTSIIDNAIHTGYISLKNNVYTILPGGEYLIESLQKLGIDMDKHKTAELGRALKRVYRGELSVNGAATIAFQEVINYFNAGKDVRLDPSSDIYKNSSIPEVLGKCPKCGADVVERKKLFGCTNKECMFALWKDDKFFAALGKEMTKTNAKGFLARGHAYVKGCISQRTGVKYDCIVHGDFSGQYPKYTINFSDNKKKK